VAKAAPRIAIVHDWMVSPGGAEKVVLEMHKLWPEAPIYTAAYSPEKFPEFAEADIRPTWLNKIALAKKKHQLFSLPRAWAFKSLNLSEFDIVISSSSAESKYVRTGSKTLHICYCYTPFRYAWYEQDRAISEVAAPLRPLLRRELGRIDGIVTRMLKFAAPGRAKFANCREKISSYE